MVAMVNEYFGKIPRPARMLYAHLHGGAGAGWRAPDRGAPRGGYSGDHGCLSHSRMAGVRTSNRLEVLAGILGEQSSGRLYKALVDNKKAAQVFGSTWIWMSPGLLCFGALLNKTDSLEAARAAMLDTIDGVVKEPPSKEEVDRARTRLIKDMDMNLRNSERIGLFISESNAKGDWRLLFLDRDRLSKVTPEDVQRVAAAYLKSSNRTIGEFIPDAKPDRAEIPAKSDVAAEVKDYKGVCGDGGRRGFRSVAEEYRARTEHYHAAFRNEGISAEKKTRGASVHAVIRLRFGDVDSLKGKDTVASWRARR